MKSIAAVIVIAIAAPAVAQPTNTPPTTTPGQTPPTVPNVNPLVLTDDEKKVLKDIEGEYERFLDQSNKHNERMRAVISREFEARQAELEKKYAERIAKAETDRTARHDATIVLLEKFIKDHPSQQQFTPDAMFRLADLYLAKADADVEVLALTNPDAIADYSKSLAMWEDILRRFPKYRQTPSTLYLLAYYGKQADERRSMQLFLALTCANKYKWTDTPSTPPTKQEALARTENRTRRDPYSDCQPYEGADAELVRHAWIRGLADYHFTVPGELDEAIASYLKVVDGGKDSPLYAESLYKLAWSYYRRDFLIESIQKFDESVKLYDSIVAAGNIPALELREESIQYISVAFTDPWVGETDSDPVKGFQRAKDFYKGRENEPHVRDVWVAMGRAFNELQAFDQAIDSFKIAIGPPWELHPQNPQTHQEIVNTYELKGDKIAADNAAAELATRYAPGTAWYAANEKDREAMEAQRRISERALYAAARNTHSAASQLRKEYEDGGKKDAQLRADYLALYTKGVELYSKFIETYPESDYIYEFTYLRGEALFFSERYMESVADYRWVVEHKSMSEQFFLDASKSILAAYEKEAERQVAAGLIQPLKVPTTDELKATPQPWNPKPIPDIYQKLQVEWDNYQNVVPDPQTAPLQGINAALVSLAYFHVDDAIVRLEKVMGKFCGNEAAVKAKDGLVSIYLASGEDAKARGVNDKFISTACGDAAAIELAKSQNRSIEFQKARDLMAEKNYVDAAAMFYTYYKTAPPADKDLPTALYNAAVAYKLAERPKTAISLFKEFTANTSKQFRENPYYLDSMRLTALSYQGAFEYKQAITTYLELYELTKKAQKLGIKPPEPLPGEQPRTLQQIGLEALSNAALAAELDRDFKRSIELYTKYEREEPSRRLKDRASWSVANIQKATGSPALYNDAAETWRRRYGNDAGNEDDYVRSYYETSKLYQRKGTTSKANEYGRLTVDAWRKKGSVKGSKGAELAGEWALTFVEREYASKFVPWKVTKRPANDKAWKKEADKLTALGKGMNDKYLALEAFGVAEVTMAVKVRFGDVVAGFGEKRPLIPMPADLFKKSKANPDIIAIWEETLGKQSIRYFDEARKQWEEVVDLAKKSGVSNKWSQIARENLNREFPDQFPVLHQELFDGTEAP